MQTLSLRLADSLGQEYTLRSIEKFPEKAVPEMLQKTFAADLVQDQISAAHPYGALTVTPLAEAAGIYHTNPQVVYIPDDPRFGVYRKEFANTLMLFEERPAGDADDDQLRLHPEARVPVRSAAALTPRRARVFREPFVAGSETAAA